MIERLLNRLLGKKHFLISVATCGDWYCMDHREQTFVLADMLPLDMPVAWLGETRL